MKSDAQVVTLNDEDTPQDMVAIINMKEEKIPLDHFSKLKENSCLLGLSVSGVSPAVSNSKGCGKHKFQGLVFVQVG